MNRVFVTLLLIAVVVALARDLLPESITSLVFTTPKAGGTRAVTEKVLETAADAARLSLSLVGVLALWMGIMRVAEKAGLIASLARVLRPLLIRLFPDVPPDHPAMGAIVMNMAANVLGLGNAATPLGLEAMKRLQELNAHKRSATNAMALFLALNTTHIRIVAPGVIALRIAQGSRDATNILLPTFLATLCGSVAAYFAARLLEKRYPVEPDGTPSEETAVGAAPTPNGGGT